MKLLISPNGKEYLLPNAQKEFHTSDGKLDLTKAKPGKTLKTNIGVEYFYIEPTFTDLLKNLKRGPQVVLPKDASTIVSVTGIGPGAKVVDAGTGSGWLTVFLAHIVAPGKVVSYEIREDFSELAEENIKQLGLKNVKIKRADITKGIKEKNLDLITLDLLTPTKVPNIPQALKLGGYCVAYVPHLEQAEEFSKFAKKQYLYVEKVIEVKEFIYRLHSGKLRQAKGVSHTGFLVFVRKVLK